MDKQARLNKTNEFIRMYLTQAEITKEDDNEITVTYSQEKPADLVKKLINTNHLYGSAGGKLVIMYGGFRIILVS